MKPSQRDHFSLVSFGKASLWLVIALSTVLAPAQTFQILHNFTGGRDGANPEDGLTIDRNGNLYGTASAGGIHGYGCQNFRGTQGCGAVFELARSGSGWILRPLYDFPDNTGTNGSGVAIGPDGALYGPGKGTGGCTDYNACGSVFRVSPPPTPCASFTCNWQETVLHQFTGTPDGSYPSSRVIFDSAGNLYGTTVFGGQQGNGAAYELSRNGGSWTENIIHTFNVNNQDLGVIFPGGQLAIDPSGNLYGPAACNSAIGCFYGAVWELQALQGGWNFNELFQFNGNNGYSPAALIRDSSGNLYGSTMGTSLGNNDSAAVYELTFSNGAWHYNLLYDYGRFGEDSTADLVMDSAGNIYGADAITGDGYIFKLTRSGDSWTFSRLHSFTGPDGAGASGQIVIDSAGNLYGTTSVGGAYGYGVIWEITP